MSAEPIGQEFEAGYDNRIYLLPPGALRDPQPQTAWSRLRASDAWNLVILELKAIGALSVAALIVVGGQQLPHLWQMIQGGLK